MKKLALIIISIDECYPQDGYRGGGHRVTRHLIDELIKSQKFIIDIYSREGSLKRVPEGINSIEIIGKRNFENKVKEKIFFNRYDYILSSDILLPFANNLVHSNSSRYKSKNSKGKISSFLALLYNREKIKKQEKNISKTKALFTVSEALKKDYIDNFKLSENKVFTSYPAVEFNDNKIENKKHQNFTIGSIAGGGLNKGGYLLLLALSKLPKNSSIKARIIFPKIHKSGFFKFMIKILGLSKRVELLGKQADMKEFYKTVDCYVLASLNEAFGLVLIESGMLGKPSIMSSTVGARELFSNGINGFIFERNKDKVKNLLNILLQAEDIYKNNYEKYIEISNGAREVSQRLNWKNFGDVIINNMVSE